MSGSTDERGREAMEHLQAAALELIAAMRVVLDAAEDLVQDPAPLLALADAAGEALAPLVDRGRAVFAQAVAARAAARPATPDDTPSRRPRVEHIRVS